MEFKDKGKSKEGARHDPQHDLPQRLRMEVGKMKKVKITILKTTLDKELAAEYGIDGLTACPMMKAGDVFYADYAKPQGFCDEAWKAIYQYVFALAHGADKSLFYYGDWIKKPGVAIVSCNSPMSARRSMEKNDETA